MEENLQEQQEGQQEEILTPDEKLSIIGDKIIASILQQSELSKRNRKYLFGMFNPDVFKDEKYLIYYTLYSFKEVGIGIDSEFLSMYLMNNVKLMKKASDKIDLGAFGGTDDEDTIITYIGVTVKAFKRLEGMPVQDFDTFKMLCEKYRLLVTAIESSKIYVNANKIVMTGAKLGRKNLYGYEDSKAYMMREFARIEAMSSRNAGEGFVLMRGREKEDEKKEVERICSWGIRELDAHFGGIFTSCFISVLAPPKNGKTKFCSQLAHNAIVAGKSVVIWAPEGGKKAFDAQLRAKHFDYVYNRDIVDVRKKKIGVDAEIIKHNRFESEELRQLEDASRVDLYNNPNYGEVLYIELPCNVETYIDNLDTAVQSVDAKLVVVDYLQLIGSENNSKSERERISDAYIKTLVFCNERNIAFVSPAQYTQEIIKDISKNGTDGSADLRTGGGGSSQVVRTPDINIALWATPEDLDRGDMSLLSIPSRDAKPFPKIDIKTELGVCNFYSKPESA